MGFCLWNMTFFVILFMIHFGRKWIWWLTTLNLFKRMRERSLLQHLESTDLCPTCHRNRGYQWTDSFSWNKNSLAPALKSTVFFLYFWSSHLIYISRTLENKLKLPKWTFWRLFVLSIMFLKGYNINSFTETCLAGLLRPYCRKISNVRS